MFAREDSTMGGVVRALDVRSGSMGIVVSARGLWVGMAGLSGYALTLYSVRDKGWGV